MSSPAWAAPVVVLDAPGSDAADHARALGLHVRRCASGRALIDGLPSSPQARALTLAALGLDGSRVRWALAIDPAEPSLDAVRRCVLDRAESTETTLGPDPTLYALFPSVAAAEAACFP